MLYHTLGCTAMFNYDGKRYKLPTYLFGNYPPGLAIHDDVKPIGDKGNGPSFICVTDEDGVGRFLHEQMIMARHIND